jgi:hypothetical protein
MVNAITRPFTRRAEHGKMPTPGQGHAALGLFILGLFIHVTRDARSTTLAACRMSFDLLHNSMRN